MSRPLVGDVCIGRRAITLILFMAVPLMVGCVQTPLRVAEPADARAGADRVLVMPPDVQLSELTAGGLNEPRADWTATARSNIFAALGEFLKDRQDTLVEYQEPTTDPTAFHTHDQLTKLHEAVGRAIVIHHYYPTFKLPTKGDKLDYSLGSQATSLGEAHDCRYGLFIYLRDSYTSSGRVAAILLAAALNIQLQGGTQIGFASLVDLQTGELVWFNRLYRGFGDLRTTASTQETVEELLANFPL